MNLPRRQKGRRVKGCGMGEGRSLLVPQDTGGGRAGMNRLTGFGKGLQRSFRLMSRE